MPYEEITTGIRDFLVKAGHFALERQATVVATYKDDGSALTEVDLAVSKLAQAHFAEWLSVPGRVLVDEEFVTRTPEDVLGSYEYILVLDPIDGTAGYAQGRMMWGISLGLLHNGQPVAGGIYLPVAGKLLMTGAEVAVVSNAAGENVKRLDAVVGKVNSQTFVEAYFGGDTRWGKTFGEGKVWIHRPESAVQGFYSVLTNGAAAGTLIQGYSLWDVAAAVALARGTGFKVLSIDDGREWEVVTAGDLTPKWKLASNWVMVHPDNYEYVAAALKG